MKHPRPILKLQNGKRSYALDLGGRVLVHAALGGQALRFVFEAQRLLYYSTLGSRVIKKKKKKPDLGNGLLVHAALGGLAHKKHPPP